jgi:hypothetical protein
MFLPNYFYFEEMSAVGYSANSESALYLTALNHEFLPSNTNISANSKPNSKIFQSVNQGHIWGQFMKKTSGQKSRATVPLRCDSYRKSLTKDLHPLTL